MKPRILLLDEPVAGMNEEETEDMARFIIDIKEELGVTILIVEHDMGVVMDISDRVVAINFGVKTGEGPPADIVRNPLVIQATWENRELPRLRPRRPPCRKEPFLERLSRNSSRTPGPEQRPLRQPDRPSGKGPGRLGSTLLGPVL